MPTTTGVARRFNYDESLRNAHPRAGVVPPAITARVGAEQRVVADQVGRLRPARHEFVSATGVATEEAARAGLPFRDAALEGRVAQTLDDVEAGAARYSQDGTVLQN
jgi:hypothetical protein